MLIPGPNRNWHCWDQGSVNAPPPLDHRLPGVGWSTCGPIGLGRYAQQDRVRVKPGETYRQPQASSFKLQAASDKLDNKDYRIIKDI